MDQTVVISLPGFAAGTEVQIVVNRLTNGIHRQPGTAKGQLKIEAGFDDPLMEFKEYH